MEELYKISSGLPGLDEILDGGLLPRKSYLVQGGPGSGKSTLGLHFLSEGSRNEEPALYITLGESEKSISRNASRMGFDLSKITFLDLSPQENLSGHSDSYTIFSAAEVEQGPIIEAVMEAIEQNRPKRVLLDSITMLRFLNNDPYLMRKKALSLINFITGCGATLMMVSESLNDPSEKDATFWVDGILTLDNGSPWRNISVTKYRGSGYDPGTHAFKITAGGITVYPRLHPGNYNRRFRKEMLSSGIAEIDNLLHGGIEKGTVSIIVGATGAGKTNLGLQFLTQAAARNQRAILYTFEESREVILERSRNIGIAVEELINNEKLKIVPVEPLSYSPDEFSKMVRMDVEKNNRSMVMIDSIGGYNLAIREESILERLHSLTVYLQNTGVTTLLVNESEHITGQFSATHMNASYLADNILFLRYLEINGELRKAIGVLKKRLSDFENTIREYRITSEGIKVGQPLNNMRGILSGNPTVIK